MTPLVLESGSARVEVAPDVGARIIRWSVDGLDLLGAHGTAPQEHGCYPMAPWCGRLRGNVVDRAGVPHPLPETFHGWAIHGTVLERPFEVTDLGPVHATLSTGLGEHWPWPGGVTVAYELAPAALSATIVVSSEAGAFPAQAGWHPWFRRRLARGAPVERTMRATALLARGDDHLPTGTRLDPADVPGPYDDAFEVPDGRVELRWPGALRLVQRSDAPWVVVFDALPDWVCVEPQTGPPDGLRGPDATIVTPGRPLVLSTTWSWTTDAAS